MTPLMQLSYDPTIDAHTVRVVAHLDTEAAFEAWAKLVDATFAPLGDKRVDLLVDIGELHMEPQVAPKYGQYMRGFAEKRVRHLVRYGTSDAATRSRVTLSAIANRYAANVCSSREEAIAVLQKLRAGAR